jgi:hypothetical protein
MPTGHHKSPGRGDYNRKRSEYNKKVAFKLREKTWRDLHVLIADGQYTKFIDAVLTRELRLIQAGESEFQQYT